MFQTPLPTELALLILSYLPLSSIRSLILTNKEWANFVEQNKSTIYRNAAFVEGYVDPHERVVSVDELAANPEERREKKSLYSHHAMKGVQGWRNFCKRRKLIEQSWVGKAESRIVPSQRPLPNTSGSECDNVDVPEPAHYKRVHRIKVDENAGITIATTQLGGLVVRDLESGAVLWELPMWYVRQYAHLEYGHGYIIFDRDDGNKEVWRRTAEIESSTPETEDVEPISTPDERQKHVVNYINHLTSNSPSRGSSSTSAHHSPNYKARFTPHAILHMPEITRAYRYVYPTLLVASLERAYLWDVRTCVLKQMISGIQVIRAPEAEEMDEQGHSAARLGEEDGNDGDMDDDHPASPSPGVAEQQQLMEEDIDLLDVLPPYNPHPRNNHHNQDPSNDDIDNDYAESSSSSDDEDEAVQLPRFLGLVRYVDLSERHVFFAGRYLLRIFSRETGKCVMDIPSTRWRYGKWRWEIASRESMGGRVGLESADLDSYEKAKGEGREAVRMPVRFSLEEYLHAGGRVVIDQFIAVHVSGDGKHVVGLLSGSRLVIIHNFESFLGPGPPIEPSPSSRGKETSSAAPAPRRHYRSSNLTANANAAGPPSSPILHHEPAFSMPGSYPSTSAPFGGHSASTSHGALPDNHNDPRARRRQAHRQRRLRNREAREMRRRAKDAKDEEIFDHTIDVQLGAPAASSGIYLAYENGRIGVVTSNAVYIVIPPIPPPPSPSSSKPGPTGVRKNQTIDVPKLEIMRLPFFSNPSWLSELSCLMMSDTGLLLNWNPLYPRMPWERDGDEDGEGDIGMADGEGAENGEGNASADARQGAGAGVTNDEPEEGGDHDIEGDGESDDGPTVLVDVQVVGRQYSNDRREQFMRKLEWEYEQDLMDYERFEGERYHLFPNGDMFVTPRPRDVIESEVSTIYRVDFIPSLDADRVGRSTTE